MFIFVIFLFFLLCAPLLVCCSLFLEQPPMIPTSKKDPAARCEELWSTVQNSLEEVCLTHTRRLARSRWGSEVMLEVVRKTEQKGKILEAIANLLTDDDEEEEEDAEDEGEAAAASDSSDDEEGGPVPSSALKTSNDAAADQSDEEDEDEDDADDADDDDDEESGPGASAKPAPVSAVDDGLPLMEHMASHILFKRLLQEEALGHREGAPSFAAMVWERIREDPLEVAHSNRGAFVLAALAACPAVAKTAWKALRSKKPQVDALPDSAGKKALLQALTPGQAVAGAKPPSAAAPTNGEAKAKKPKKARA